MNRIEEVCQNCPDQGSCFGFDGRVPVKLFSQVIIINDGHIGVWQVPDECTRKLEHLVLEQKYETPNVNMQPV